MEVSFAHGCLESDFLPLPGGFPEPPIIIPAPPIAPVPIPVAIIGIDNWDGGMEGDAPGAAGAIIAIGSALTDAEVLKAMTTSPK
jgi:hypothetical protein